MRLPDPLAAHLRELWLGVRLLPEVVRELPYILESNAASSAAFWKAHEKAVWLMLLTVALLWIIALAAIALGLL